MTRPITRALLLAAVVCLTPEVIAAQRPEPPLAAQDTVTLTLGEAIARAIGQSEEVRLARAAVDLAAAQVTAARSAALPQLDATVAYTRTFESAFSGGGVTIPDSLRFNPDPTASVEERLRYLEENSDRAALGALGGLFGNLPFGRPNAYTAALNGTQVLYSGGRVGAAMQIARDYREAARLTYVERVAEIELHVRRAYYAAALAGELEAIAQAALEQAETFLSQQRLRFDAGTASELDVLRADVSAENLRPQLIAARNAASLATLDLKRLIDLPLTQPVRLTTPLTPPSPSEMVSREGEIAATTRRAAIASAERFVSIREQQVRIARGSFLPQVGLSGTYGRQLFPERPFSFGGETWNRDASATIGVQIPIFSGFRRQAELTEARIGVTQARLEVAQLREAVEMETEQARGERERALASIAARQRTVEQAQRVHDLTVLRYESGLATQLEVSDARLALLQARTNVAQAIADYHIADAGFSRAVGLPSRAASGGTVPPSPSRQQPAVTPPAPATTPAGTPPVIPPTDPSTNPPTTGAATPPVAPDPGGAP